MDTRSRVTCPFAYTQTCCFCHGHHGVSSNDFNVTDSLVYPKKKNGHAGVKSSSKSEEDMSEYISTTGTTSCIIHEEVTRFAVTGRSQRGQNKRKSSHKTLRLIRKTKKVTNSTTEYPFNRAQCFSSGEVKGTSENRNGPIQEKGSRASGRWPDDPFDSFDPMLA